MSKGSDRRPTQISEAELAANWLRTFGPDANQAICLPSAHVWFRPMQPAASNIKVCRKCGVSK